MRVRLVRNRSTYGHVHREDCLSKGYGVNCELWTAPAYETGVLVRGLENIFDVELLAEKGDDEGVRFCTRCLPDVHWKAMEVRRRRATAMAYGVRP